MCPDGNFRAEGVDSWERGCLLGRGSTASVYALRDPATGSVCAVKEFSPPSHPPHSPVGTPPHPLEQWPRATLTVPRDLEHPNIAAPRAVTRRGDVVQDYVPGRTLHEVITASHAIPEAQVAALMRGVARGLSYLHAKGIVHGDVKSHNCSI
ncbi:kinase-like domain-containing protein [Baffinella frigidus]|nr:kinase-like domain-containing protein [Cryptophyta sp. CCMP2293]